MCARFPRRFALVTAIVLSAAVEAKAKETSEGGELARPTILEHCEQSESPSDLRRTDQIIG